MAGGKKIESPKNNKIFDSQKYQELLRTGGTFSISEEYPNIDIGYIGSKKIGNGFGTAVMRHVAEQIIENDGTITLQAVWSSHIFHLYMGMIPIDREVNYLKVTYGMDSQSCLEKFRDYPEDELSPSIINKLIFIFRMEKQIAEDQILTLQDISNDDNRSFLLKLLDKKGSYLIHEFIPNLLYIFETNITQKFPSTSSMRSVNMQLSNEGKLRWANAINEQIDFEPFRDFAQLLPYMTEEQKKQLHSILERRAEHFGKQKETTNAEITLQTNPEKQLAKSSESAHIALSLFPPGPNERQATNNTVIQPKI
ncbi:hypothetical protein [Legionella resiliens]|uniref:Dot/Icm T4SS effector n=1 Tax=Legionella resiliens TaxID=2905958 RepID=A0ABS8WZP4_9GAMM|nr:MULTISPECIES: hypothetical protein [unclassified Legionella]MCE0722808.1 hypothetical protein [Legionella sp. 9fVS26]MCE3531961.1 hypothetical protein [Legionella sp. 8cVS16]